MHIQLQIVSKLLSILGGCNSAEGGTYQLADMYRRGPNPLADMDRGVHIRGESKSAVTRLLSNKTHAHALISLLIR